MLDGNRRGYQIGMQIATLFPCLLTNEEVGQVAQFVLLLLRKRNWAHLEPEQDFVRSFVEGYQLQVTLLSRKERISL